jgi:hypothetical protein
MQTLAFVWFELHVGRRRLRETFADNQIPAEAANGSADTPSSVGTRWCGAVKEAPRIVSAQQALASRFRRHNIFRAIGSLFGKLHSNKAESGRAVIQAPRKSESTDSWKVHNRRSRPISCRSAFLASERGASRKMEQKVKWVGRVGSKMELNETRRC